MRPPPVLVQLLFHACVIAAVGVLPPYSRLEVPFAHVALSGDLHITLHSPPDPLPELRLAIHRLEAGISHFLEDIPIHPSPSIASLQNQDEWSQNGNWIQNQDKPIENKTQNKLKISNTKSIEFTVPCGYFVKGGTYLLRIHGAEENITEVEATQDSKLSGVLDVRWPSPKLTLTPENIQTFPEHSVTGIVEFPELMCPPSESAMSYIPEFYLEVWYCGDGGPTMCSTNPTGTPLYSENVKGLSGRREVILRCELFGIAGTYSMTLRPTIPQPTLATSTAYLKARWSEQFVLTVHARSVMPCDSHAGGVPVLLQYPACVLERADRVRVYARTEPPHSGASGNTRANYIAELRVTRGTHSLRFPCELFTERYPEYCFVYVSQAINGAVSDIREECLPTLPIVDGAVSGGWGPWSPWSPCSSRCGGTKARYRYCDSPPPPYGAPYCQGPAVESEPCVIEGQPCPWTPGSQSSLGDPCRCGCVLRLGPTPRHLSASAQECQGRTFWLLEASAGHVIRLTVEQYRLPCGAQWLKARDGGSPGAPLLGQWPNDGETKGESVGDAEGNKVFSSGQQILLEFFSDELLAAGMSCPGGFMANAAQVEPVVSNASASIAVSMSETHTSNHSVMNGVLLLSVLAAAGLLLAAPALCWIVLRTLHASSKYQRANDCDSLADSDIGPGSTAAIAGLGGSRGTLLSEVLSLRRLRPSVGAGGASHRLLRESRDLTEEVGCTEVLQQGHHNGMEAQDGGWSSGSSITLAAVETPPHTARPGSGHSLPPSCPSTTNTDLNSSPLRRSRTCSPVKHSQTNTHSQISETDSTSISMEMSASERDSDASYASRIGGFISKRSAISECGSRSDSVNTLTNGCYSPALSTTSCARVRTTGGKERKDRRNLRLKAPPSDLSLAAQELEMDYYDYNVTNAGAVPGSYLGMDPAFLVWIPPLDESDETTLKNYDEILPQSKVDPGSNTESPEDYQEQHRNPKQRVLSEENTPLSSPKIDRRLLAKTNLVHPLNFSISDLAPPKLETSVEKSKKQVYPRGEPFTRQAAIQMKELSIDNNKLHEVVARCHHEEEKETSCEKSPTVEHFGNISDIQFADEDSDSSNGMNKENGDVILQNNSLRV